MPLLSFNIVNEVKMVISRYNLSVFETLQYILIVKLIGMLTFALLSWADM